MLPELYLSTTAARSQFVNPWSGRPDVSTHWGPIAISDNSEGMHARLWTARAIGDEVRLSAPGVPESVWYIHDDQIREISLAFNQNGQPAIALVDAAGDPLLRWYDPVPEAIVNLSLDAGTINPRLTLDDYRLFNIGNSDVVLGYVTGGFLRYRLQRDRFEIEYTPGVGDGGAPAAANSLRHVSMNAGLRLEFMADQGGDTDWSLPLVIQDICQRANLSEAHINLVRLDWAKRVRGYTIGGAYQGAGILQTLSGVFFFDPANANGRVAFVPRGADAVDTILDADMIDDGEEIQEPEASRRDAIAIPRVLHLNYYDVNGGLNTDKQRSERPEGTRAEGEQSLQTPVILSADEAASVVAITHGLMVEQQKGELNFAMPDNWLRLIESDPVLIETNNKMVRGIITKVQTDDGEQRYKAIRDRQSLYGVSVQGIPAAPVTRPPSSIAGATILEFLDIPVLRDSHDQLGFYMAVSGLLPAWPGATVEMSLDGGATYIARQSTRASSVMGSLVTALGDHPHEFPDEVNACQIVLDTPNALLENTTLAGMLGRRNLAIVGDELINFANADEVTEGVWEISYLLRGRKHTDVEAHSIGERFVLLSSAMFVPAELSWLSRTLTFRATTFGRPVDEATIISATFTGATQTEFAPAYLQARRDGADVVASWQGVGRLGSGAHVAMGAYFQGFRVTLTDGATTQTIDQVAESITTSLAAFTGPVTVRVQQRNQLTGLGPYIEVTI
jgi:hypothetical protein